VLLRRIPVAISEHILEEKLLRKDCWRMSSLTARASTLDYNIDYVLISFIFLLITKK